MRPRNDSFLDSAKTDTKRTDAASEEESERKQNPQVRNQEDLVQLMKLYAHAVPAESLEDKKIAIEPALDKLVKGLWSHLPCLQVGYLVSHP